MPITCHVYMCILRSQINSVASKANYAKEKQSGLESGVADGYFPLVHRMESSHVGVKDGNKEKNGYSPP